LLVDLVRFEQLNHFVAFILLVQKFELLKLKRGGGGGRRRRRGRRKRRRGGPKESLTDVVVVVVFVFLVADAAIRD
jgi:hypothetical protein